MLDLEKIFSYSAKEPLLFNQYVFLLLFTVMFAGYTLVHSKTKIRNIYLLVFSLFFYYKCSGLYFLLLIFSTVADYILGFLIHNSKKKSNKKTFLISSIVVNLGLLGFFKYSYFFVDSINSLFGISWEAVNFLSVFANQLAIGHFDIHEILLPVGISFYTFQTLSYSIDIYRGKIEPCDSFFDFAFFVSFFPQLVAGPIVRAADFLPQIKRPYYLSSDGFANAVYLIMAGLIKKVVISDYISVNFVDRVFETPDIYSGFMNLMAVYGYSIQIYCDFSGYSDMAIGLAALLGFTLPINFNSPYKSLNITDFWRRWHISLSTWLRDYLYISLGGNRKGKLRTYFNLFVTMLLGGLWHGAALKFIVWGSLHGVALAFHKIWSKYVQLSLGSFGKILSFFVTFHFVAFCWLYFRAPDMNTVYVMLDNIWSNFDIGGAWTRVEGYWRVFALMGLGYVVHLLPRSLKGGVQRTFRDSPIYVKIALFVLVIFGIYQATTAGIQPFIYFQF